MALNPLIDGGGRESLEEVSAWGCFRCELYPVVAVSEPSDQRRGRLGCKR